MGITKHNWLVKRAEDIPRTVAAAFHVATTGRPGPVLIDVPKDVSNAEMEWYWPESEADLDLPGYHPRTEGDPAAIAAAAELMLAAERPVLYVGGGVLKARGAAALLELAERTGFPVVTTLMARGAFPDSHPLCLGHARDARQLHGGHGDAAGRPAGRPRRPLRRPGDRPGRRLRPRGQGRPRRHRPGRDRARSGCPRSASSGTAGW